MTTDPLTLPVGGTSRTTEFLNPEDSLDRAGSLLRNTAYPFVPIVDRGKYVGAVSEGSLAGVWAQAVPASESCQAALVDVPTIMAHETGAEALRRFNEEQETALLVLGDDGRVIGVIGPSDLLPQPRRTPTPPTIGGMATPFGVYLTTGSVHGGAKPYALAASGSLLFCLFLLTDQLVWYLSDKWAPIMPYASWIGALAFLLTIRLIPLSGTHAAEHMVVHAIERGEPLLPSIVRRMPRVHPRCGTNLAVAGSVFLTLFNWEWSQDQSLRVLAALIAAYVLYRPLGSLVQFCITTKPPTQSQLEDGIKAGKELLERYSTRRGPVPGPLARILNSGMLHVAAGSTLTYVVLKGIATVFNLPFDL